MVVIFKDYFLLVDGAGAMLDGLDGVVDALVDLDGENSGTYCILSGSAWLSHLPSEYLGVGVVCICES